MATKIFGLELTKKEISKIIHPKKLLITGLSALAINFVVLAPFGFIWEGWNVVLSSVGGSILAEWLD